MLSKGSTVMATAVTSTVDCLDNYRALLYKIFHYHHYYNHLGLTDEQFNDLKYEATKLEFTRSTEANLDIYNFKPTNRNGFCEALMKSGLVNRNDFSTLKRLLKRINRGDLIKLIELFEQEEQNQGFSLEEGINGIHLHDEEEEKWYQERYNRCTSGGIKESLMSFEFTTYDLQEVEVE